MKDDIQERWNEGYYSALNGAKIIRFIGTVSEEFGTGFPQFLVKLSTGEIIEMEVSKDPEGNGGGFLFGLPDFTLPEFRENLIRGKNA
jgi:hypothetical protein